LAGRDVSAPRPELLLIGPSPPPYNGMTVATELASHALEAHVLPCIYLDTADRRGLSNVGKLDLWNLLLAAKHGIRCMWILLTKRPRIVYVPIAQSWLPFLRDCLFLIPSRLLRREVVIHLHGGYFKRFYGETSPLMRWIIHRALANTRCAIVLGRNVADAFEGILPRERIRIVPNGIPDTFAERTPRVGNGNKTHTLLYLSALVAEKGVLDLLRALPKVRERAGNVRAVVAGEWCSERDREVARQLIERAGLENMVEFAGPVGPDRKRELLTNADAFVFPTAYRYEGHPYVILEAMAASLPVISTNVACIPETVRDGVEGFLVESGDVNALADRIGRLLVDEPLRARMGEAGRERFLRCYSYDKFAERMKAVFAEVLEPVARFEDLSDAGFRKS
jgi:glycosyltransferase involved in cell wall biosynthesis